MAYDDLSNVQKGSVMRYLFLIAPLFVLYPDPANADNAPHVQLYKWQAEQGDVDAQMALAGIYSHDGMGVPKNFKEAAKWLAMAAKQGNAKAEYALSSWYDVGQGVPNNETLAFSWCRKAAEQGYKMAQNGLAMSYYLGIGTPKDLAEAEKWLRRAAEQGDSQSQAILGVMYANGQGVPHDNAESYFWLSLSRREGNSKSVDGSDSVYKDETRSLSSEAIALIRQRVREWKPVKESER